MDSLSSSTDSSGFTNLTPAYNIVVEAKANSSTTTAALPFVSIAKYSSGARIHTPPLMAKPSNYIFTREGQFKSIKLRLAKSIGRIRE